MKRERQNRNRSFCQFVPIDFVRQFVRWHFVPSRPADDPHFSRGGS
jgi:hypothetical protein